MNDELLYPVMELSQLAWLTVGLLPLDWQHRVHPTHVNARGVALYSNCFTSCVSIHTYGLHLTFNQHILVTEIAICFTKTRLGECGTSAWIKLATVTYGYDIKVAIKCRQQRLIASAGHVTRFMSRCPRSSYCGDNTHTFYKPVSWLIRSY